jgi:hypothetical protein
MMRRTPLVAAVAAAVMTLTWVASMPASSASTNSTLAEVRAATARYHSVAAAEADGYVKFLACFDSATEGGMGQHWANLNALDGTVSATEPEVLVYQERDHGYQLVGVEYVVPQAAWQGEDPPELFGQHFHTNDGLGIYALHAWIWKPNPAGMYADFNPRVPQCRG